MRYPLQLALLTGATLLVAACGGGAANNAATPAVDNGTVVTNDPMAPDLNAPMPMDNNAMAAPAPDANGAAPAANSTNAM